MLSVPPRMGLEYQLVAVQHIGIDRRVRRTPLANPFARDPQQHLPSLIMQVRRAQRADHFGGIRGGAGGHVPRFPSTVVARRSAPSPLNATSTIVRAGLREARRRPTSSNAAVPDALSSAPLWTRPVESGSSAPNPPLPR